MIEFNMNSNDHMSVLLYSGQLQVDVQEPVLDKNGLPQVIKTGQKIGQMKTKKSKKDIYIQGLNLIPRPDTECAKKGFYKTNETILSELLEDAPEDAKKVIGLILEIRGLEKQIGTYYEGLEELIYPDECVHAQFNHCATDTARLSSNKPNLQNQPSNKVSRAKEHFVSRFV
jgi:DNA polymerase I-like protein with 3'-5' exonuclease and polymerase domains